MQLYGYGEDALTFQAVTTGLGRLLAQLDDPSNPNDTTVLFRPSFGRRGRTRHGRRGSSFGEFDAIIGTPQAVYLIESKWSRSGEAWRPSLMLRSEQTRRHDVFRWYLDRWRTECATDWPAFATPSVIADFEDAFPELTLPRNESGLADSLCYLLPMLAAMGKSTQDVLLYCDVDKRQCPPLSDLLPFKLVNMPISNAHASGYFAMKMSAF
jgi:hypothetical protein